MPRYLVFTGSRPFLAPCGPSHCRLAPRTFSEKSFACHTYEKCACKSFSGHSYKTKDLKSFVYHTFTEEPQGGTPSFAFPRLPPPLSESSRLPSPSPASSYSNSRKLDLPLSCVRCYHRNHRHE